ncbi:hypothetical protein [Chitinophaga sp.]|uniref:hypothetical protein n=1 Tax=Chitinophaga sp. TaxID=1869181 RepID=UPI0031DB4A72
MNIISLGLGVQSTALYFMSSMGELPRADYAITADPGREKAGTYKYLQFLLQWQSDNSGIPIIVTDKKNLFEDLLKGTNSSGNRFASIPCFTKNDDGSQGMLRRQCTSEYKIGPVDEVIRRLYGMRPRQRRPETFVWKGITVDELDRMSEPEQKWKRHVYPFTGYQFNAKGIWEKLNWGIQMSRVDLYNWYQKMGFPIPPKSSCVFCPYQSDLNWSRMKKHNPEDFDAAVQVDYAIRNSTQKGVKNQCFLHRSMTPLDMVEFDDQDDLWSGECSGNCHI